MKNHASMKLSMLILIVLSSVQTPATADTNAVSSSSITVSFKNASASQVAAIMANFSQKPIAVSRFASVSVIVSYQQQQPVTREQVFENMKKSLPEQGCALLNAGNEAFKLVTTGETNQQGNFPLIQIDVQTNSIVVGEQPVAFSELWNVIKSRMTPEMEIWIHDANPEPGVRTPGGKYVPSVHQPYEVIEMLIREKVRAEKIYQVYLPRK
jgi:hypothetical protein